MEKVRDNLRRHWEDYEVNVKKTRRNTDRELAEVRRQESRKLFFILVVFPIAASIASILTLGYYN